MPVGVLVPKTFSWEIKRLKPRWELGVRRCCLLYVLLAQSSLRGHRGTSDTEEHWQANQPSSSFWDRPAWHWGSHLYCRTLNMDIHQHKLPREQNLRHHSQQTHHLRSFKSYLAVKSSDDLMDVPSCICTFGWRNWDALSGYGGGSSSRPSRL